MVLLTVMLMAKNKLLNLEYGWTKGFLNSLSNGEPSNSINGQFSSSLHSERIRWNEQNYM
jgi:hypothetical protein